MTENEVKKHLKLCKESRLFIPKKDVLDTAIQALEEIQQYRAIGTIEEFKALKEKQYDCTIKHLTNECSYKETGCSDCKGYWKIRKLLEKNVAKKSKEVHENEICIDFICPNCKEAVYGQPYRPNYCKHCGQKLDWE